MNFSVGDSQIHKIQVHVAEGGGCTRLEEEGIANNLEENLGSGI